jgi:hypothetical protein
MRDGYCQQSAPSMMGVKKLKTQRVTERQIGIGVKHGTNFPTSMPSFIPRNVGTL